MLRRYYLRKALEFANRIRAHEGLPPAPRLDKGTSAGYDCPLARTIGGGARVDTGILGDAACTRAFGRTMTMPWAVRQFVLAFDRGEYPELEDDQRVLYGLPLIECSDLPEGVFAVRSDADTVVVDCRTESEQPAAASPTAA